MQWPPKIGTVPVLETPRLVLRRFRASDIDAVFNLVSDLAVAKWTARIPHPYERKMTEEWLRDAEHLRIEGKSLAFAVTLRDTGAVIGSVSFEIEPVPGRAEIGYYLGRSYWGGGYMTEAAEAALDCGFKKLGFQIVHSEVFLENTASSNVLRKLGFAVLGPAVVAAPARGRDVAANAFELDLKTWTARKGKS